MRRDSMQDYSTGVGAAQQSPPSPISLSLSRESTREGPRRRPLNTYTTVITVDQSRVTLLLHTFLVGDCHCHQTKL